MDLTQEQRESVAKWVADGLSLADIQKQLGDEYDLNMTYMDVRVLVLDLGLDVRDRKEATPAKDVTDAPMDAVPSADGDLGAGGVSVELDRVVKPGSVVSGTVVFSDGERASWHLDQLGRLAIQAGTPDYRPSETDVQAFQEELREALAKRGF